MKEAAAATAPPVGIGWRHPHYTALFEARPTIDFLEVHSENFFGDGGPALALLDEARASYPVSLHGVGLGLGSAAGLDAWHLDRLAGLAERIDPVRISDHACFARAPANGRLIHAADLLPLPFSTTALDVICRNVAQVQDRLGRRILVENISAYVGLAGSEMAETEFLNTLARRTGCGLLIDVNNIYVNALNASLHAERSDPVGDCRDWLDRVDPATVGEIHLAGHCAMPDIVIDDHGSRVTPAVWTLYAHAIGRFGPVPTLIEWDTGIPALAVLLDEADRAKAVANSVVVGAPA